MDNEFLEGYSIDFFFLKSIYVDELYILQKYYEWEDVWNGIVKKLWEQLASKRYLDMLHRWRKDEKPAFVSDVVWHSWQHRWNDALFQLIRERQLRNHHIEIGGPRSGMA